MARPARKLKVISRLGMRQVPNGLAFVHWAATVPNNHAEANDESRPTCANVGVHGDKTTHVAKDVTCPLCRVAMIKAGHAKAVPKFGTKTADGSAIYL